LRERAQQIVQQSLKLSAYAHESTRRELRELVRAMNSYSATGSRVRALTLEILSARYDKISPTSRISPNCSELLLLI
jgi:hypothetical protein